METSHSPEQFNVSSYAATVLGIVTLEVFAGMWINAFIVSVICMAWIQKKSLNSNEKILLLLGFSRFWHICFSWLFSFLSIIYPHFLLVHPRYILLASVLNFFAFSSLWGTACLSVFYCAKIANFRNNCFIYLKVKIDRIVPWLLLGSLLLALAIGILVCIIGDKNLYNNVTGQGNFSKVRIKVDDAFFPIYFFTALGYAASFTAVAFSALLLLLSLWRHKHNMQANSMKDLSMDAHIKAMKSILSFLVMYSINFGFLILELTSSMNKENLILFLIYVFLYAFPGVHSLVLIFSNPKLEKTLLSILPCLKCKACKR